MNQIGFGVKNKYKIFKVIKIQIVKTLRFLAPFLISLSILLAIFYIPQKQAWIAYSSVPEQVYLSGFEGRIHSLTSIILIDEFSGEFINLSNIVLEYNREKIELAPGDLFIKFKYSGVGIPYATSIVADKPLTVDIIDSVPKNISIEHNINDQFDLIDGNQNYYMKSEEITNLSAVSLNDIKLTILGDFEIFIKHKKLDLGNLENHFAEIKLYRTNQEDIMIFQLQKLRSPKIAIYYSQNNSLSLVGKSKTFNVLNKSGDLKFTETSDTKNYEFANIVINGKATNEKLSTILNLSKMKSELELFGYVNNINIASNSLFLNFSAWAINNLSLIVTFILTTTLSLLLSKKI